MTYAEANHLSRAITKCVMRCRRSSDPYLELSNFVSALRDGGVSEHELAGAKGYLVGSLALSLESSSSRMNRMGRAELTMGEIPSLDWVVEQVDAVTPDDVGRVIDRVLGGAERTLALVGPPGTLPA